MNTGHFEQISDCWSPEVQPPLYYRTTAARARRLQADATTPRVKQYLDKMIAHCERLACKAEPGVTRPRPATIGRSRTPAHQFRRPRPNQSSAALARLAPLSGGAADGQQCRGCEEIKPLSHEPWTTLAV